MYSKKSKTTIKIDKDDDLKRKLRTGHKDRHNSAGPMQDKRTKRNRTRSDRNKKEIDEQRE